jgi:hypothetical protein
MARALDAGSCYAFTDSTSELRGKETDPQPDRVGFKQLEKRQGRSLQSYSDRRYGGSGCAGGERALHQGPGPGRFAGYLHCFCCVLSLYFIVSKARSVVLPGTIKAGKHFTTSGKLTIVDNWDKSGYVRIS